MLPPPDIPAAAVPQSPSSLTAIDLAGIRSLTDVGAMTRLLHQLIAHQRSLDLSLSSLSPLSLPSLPSLSSAADESNHLLSSLSSTASLADAVSAPVRSLDLAQRNVMETALVIDDMEEKGRCFEEVEKGVREGEYEAAARGVKRWLEIDERVREGEGGGEGERERLLQYKRELEGVVRGRVAEAVERGEGEEVVRFVKVFPVLGLEEEGLQVYVNYMKKVISMRSRMELDQLAESIENSYVNTIGYSKQVDFVGCLTTLFKDIVMAIEENVDILRSLCGEDGIVYAICELQEECDSRGPLIVKQYMEYRMLGKLASEINSYTKSLLSVGNVEGPDPREIELYLEEILSLTQLSEDYTEYMVSKIKGLSSIDPELGPRATKAFRSGSLSKVVQDITGFYVILEEFFMVENVRKAIRIDEYAPDSLTTSMVDDVFYLLQSCCRRAISTSNINSVLAVLSGASNLLSNEYLEALQQNMREPNLGAKLFLGGAGVAKTGAEIATALNNMDVSSEYVLKLRYEIEEQCAEIFPAPADREKIKSCLSELGEMSDSFKQALNAGMEQLAATITPRIRPVLDTVATISYELSEADYAENELNDPWVQRLLHAVETNAAWLQPFMTTSNYDSLVHLIIDFIVKRLEVIMMQKRFSQLGGLQLDRDTRALVSHFSGMTQRTVRDKFARLTQMATILNLEKVSEILDFWGENSGPMTWRLTPADVRRVLGLRIDFKPEAIAALKL
ncbi:Conserved oligomeric Golgi complex subunit 4-like protein [Drosera capensis]